MLTSILVLLNFLAIHSLSSYSPMKLQRKYVLSSNKNVAFSLSANQSCSTVSFVVPTLRCARHMALYIHCCRNKCLSKDLPYDVFYEIRCFCYREFYKVL